MSKKLKRCVRKVDKQKGKSESDAYAICNASINKESKLPRFIQYYSEAKMSATPKGFKDIKVDIISPKGEPIVVYSGTDRQIHWRAGGFDSAALAQKLLSYHKSGIDVYPFNYTYLKIQLLENTPRLSTTKVRTSLSFFFLISSVALTS